MDVSKRSIYHILLIEDNSGDELLFKEILSRSRFNTICDAVANGEDAMDFLQKRGTYGAAPVPDLVLMDLTLPRQNGFELLTVIKNDPDLKSTPVIVFTGSDRSEDIRKAYALGANGYMTKPIGLKELEQKVKVMEEFWFGMTRIPSKLD